MNDFEFMPAYKIGNEAIDYQYNSKLKSRLIDCLRDFRAKGIYTSEAFAQSGIQKIILEETGLNIMPRIDKADYPNAYVYIPDIDKNNPIMVNFLRGWRSNSDLTTVMNFTNGKFDGLVDRKTGKVHGTFSKMAVPIYLTRGLISERNNFTIEEIAAVLGHELGHVWSYYERLIDLVSMNYAAAVTADRVLKTSRDEDRVILLTEYEKVTDTKLAEKETIANSESGRVIYTHLVSETVRNRRNVEGDEIYSYRGFEFSSDQFCTRHGFGAELSTGLARIYSDYNHSSSISWTAFIIINALSALITLTALGVLVFAGQWFLAIFSTLCILSFNPNEKIYDDPKQRIIRIRNEVIGSLKTASKEQKLEIVAQIAAIDEIANDLEDKADWHAAIWKYLIPSGRKTWSSMEFQQTMESLMNNELFAAAAKLETIK